MPMSAQDRFAFLQQGQVGTELVGGLVASGGILGAGTEHNRVELEDGAAIRPLAQVVGQFGETTTIHPRAHLVEHLAKAE